MFRPGEIVIAAFPFSSLAGMKRRPCLVLAAGDTPNDFLVAFITTNASAAGFASAVAIDSSHSAWKQTGLKTPSVVRCDKLVTLHDSVISGAIGVLPNDLLLAARAKLKRLLSIP